MGSRGTAWGTQEAAKGQAQHHHLAAMEGRKGECNSAWGWVMEDCPGDGRVPVNSEAGIEAI